MIRSLYYYCTRQSIPDFSNTVQKEILVCIDLRTALEQFVTMSSSTCKIREHQKIVTKYSYLL